MQRRFRRRIAAALVIAPVLLVAGCAGLLGGKEHTPVAVYVLSLDRADPPADAESSGKCGTLEVSAPSPAPGYATARMLYQREEHRLETFAYSRWAEPPAQMLQAAMLDALHRGGPFGAVLAAPAAVRPDFILRSDSLTVLQRFESGGSAVEVSLGVQLVDEHHDRLLAAERLAATVSAEPRPQAGVDAANRALEQVMTALVELTRRSVDCAAVPAG